MKTNAVVPLDGSPAAEAALPLALRLADDGALTICLIAVLRPADTSSAVTFGVGLSGGLPAEVIEAKRQAVEGDLQAVARTLPPDTDVTWSVRVGDPATVIAAYAAEVNAASIIMATHGRTGVARWALGSVAEQMLGLSTVPILLVRTGGEPVAARVPQASSPFTHVLVPLDGSKLAQAVLWPLLELADETSPRIELLQVVEPIPQAATFDSPIELPDTEQLAARMVEHAQAELRRAADELRQRGCEVGVHVRVGSPAETILAAAQELGVGLIAMSTHGRSGVSRWLFGSVAARITRAAETPLLVLNARAAWRTQRPIVRARDVMTRDVVTVRPEQSLADVVGLLIRRQVSGAPVVTAGGQLVGMISEYDLVAWEDQRSRAQSGRAEGLAFGLPTRSVRELRERTVADLMTRQVIAVDPETPVSTIARTMIDRQVSRVPIIEAGRLVGVVSRLDVVRALAIELAETGG